MSKKLQTLKVVAILGTFIIYFFILPNYIDAAVIAEEDFESYSDGDLNGGSGGTGWASAWAGATNFDVQGSVFNTGAKGVILASGEHNIDRTIDGVSGVVTITWFMRSGSHGFPAAYIYDGSTIAATFALETTGTRFNCNSTTFDTYSLNTWYEMQLEIDTDADTVRCRYDGGSFTSPIALLNNITEVSKIRLYSAGYPGNYYWDDITIESEEEEEPPPEGGSATSTDSLILDAQAQQNLFYGFVLFYMFMAFPMWLFRNR